MWREVKVDAFARLHALAHTVVEIKPEKFGNTLANLEDISYTLIETVVDV